MTAPADILGSPREWARDLAIATGVGVFLGVIGPFGSFLAGPLELRVFYWVANMWIGFVIMAIAARLALRAGERLDLPVWFALPVGVALGAAPLAIALQTFSRLFWAGAPGHAGSLPVWYGQTLAIAEPCAFGYYLLRSRGIARQPPPASPAIPATASAVPAAGSSFLTRLSGRVGRDLLCLQMEDHYVRAHTAQGSELILLPLKEAVAELDGLEGVQVHRSWWVARPAVAGVVQDGRNLRLRLTNGLEAPVSRASVAQLRAAGWLEP